MVDALRLDEIEDGLSEIERLNLRVRAIEDKLRPFVERLASKLLEMYAVSTVVAAGLLGHAGTLRKKLRRVCNACRRCPSALLEREVIRGSTHNQAA